MTICWGVCSSIWMNRRWQNAGINVREGAEVYNYALTQMALTAEDKVLTDIIRGLDKERLSKILKAVE